MNFCFRLVCLFTVSVMATHALSQDLSGWSDKTVCRLLLKNPDNTDYLEEGASRSLDCASGTKNSTKNGTSTKINNSATASEKTIKDMTNRYHAYYKYEEQKNSVLKYTVAHTTRIYLLNKKAISEIQSIREDFHKNVFVPGDMFELNPELEKAGRVADFIELGELFANDALNREESCGGHFREEFIELDGEQKGEAKRDDTNYTFVSAWEWTGDPSKSKLHKEELTFNDIELKQRSYK